MVERNSPKHATASPFVKEFPLRAPTIVKANIPSIKSSGEPNATIIGRANGSDATKTTAPNRPPIAETVKAAPNALCACPFLASGKPSKIVACEAAVPGTPSITEAIVSLVDVTAYKPIKSAKA